MKFLRIEVESVAQLSILKHDILINATGASSRHLKDVADSSLVPYRLQSIVLKSEYDECYIYRGNGGFYFNIFGRGDGTAYVGGIKELGSHDKTVYHENRILVGLKGHTYHASIFDNMLSQILSRGHEVLPSIFPSANPGDYRILYDIGNTYYFRPQAKGGARVEKEIIGNQKVIHAYGQEAGGYCYSFGVSRRVAELAAEYLYEQPVLSRL